MFGYRWDAFLSLLTWVLLTQGAQAAPCAGGRVEVVSQTSEEVFTWVCESSTAALIFLETLQLIPAQVIELAVVDQPLIEQGQALFGSYDAAENLVRVMSPAAIQAQFVVAKIYGQPFELAYYPGVVAHEITHAVVRQYAPGLNRTAQEYLAHVTQLAVVPELQRRQIIDMADVSPWQRDDVISDIYMALAPTKFAVKCYLHLTQHPHPLQVVQMLLRSKWRYVVAI